MFVRLLQIIRRLSKRHGQATGEGRAPGETQLVIRAFYVPVDESGDRDKTARRPQNRVIGKAIDGARRSTGRLPRPKARAGPVVRTGKLEVDLKTRSVRADGEAIHLTGKEYGTLELLTLHKGTVLTKQTILDHLYGGRDEPELKIVDVFVCKLRKKLAAATGGESYIATVQGHGYVLRDPTDTSM